MNDPYEVAKYMETVGIRLFFDRVLSLFQYTGYSSADFGMIRD